jgi:hypothetical protein
MSEVFVDAQPENVVPANKWHELSINQLFAQRSYLLDKYDAFRGKPAYQKPLAQALDRLEALITQRQQQPS